MINPPNLNALIEMKQNRPKKRRSEEEMASIGLLPLIDAAIELEQGFSESSRGTGGMVSSVGNENFYNLDPSKLKRYKTVQENNEGIRKRVRMEDSEILLDPEESKSFKTCAETLGTKEGEDATEPNTMKARNAGTVKHAEYKRDEGNFLLASVLKNSDKRNKKKSKWSELEKGVKILKVKIIDHGKVLNFSDEIPCVMDESSFENPEASSESGSQNLQQLPYKDLKAKPWALTWEAINSDFLSDIPSVAPTALPPKSRHDNSIYSRWCSTMLNALSGSARCFASHEFFYSDVDRGWYNMSDFAYNLAKIGVKQNSKLSKLEWSLVRKGINRRCRRFSQSFIAFEMKRLNLYRDLVRDVQRGKTNARHGGMYEIPAAISVGSTVSAYNKRARMVQRGVVLLHDKVRPGYIVMFDRKELGCEFCPDTDVARHGPPNLLIEPSNFAVDGSVIGNFNNPHVVVGSLPYGTTRNLDTFYKKAQLKHIVNKLTAETLKSRTPKQEQLIEAVAEREALMKLLSLVDAMIERKDLLLDALEMMHSSIASLKPYHGLDNDFQEHYSWLHANLDETNLQLDAALAHLQILYGKAYYASGRFSQKQASGETLRHQQRKDFNEIFENQVRSTMEATLDISKEIVQRVREDSAGNVSMTSVGDVLNVKLAQATRLLLSVSLLVDQVRGSGTTSSLWCNGEKDIIAGTSVESPSQGAQLSDTILRRVLTASLHALAPNTTASTKTGSFETAHTAAFRELCEAVELLQSVL